MHNQRQLRGGALLAEALVDKGVEHVFTLAGGFCNPALEGFMALEMPVINTPHEQVAGHLADGHTRVSRKPSVCLVGPEGFCNAIPAIMEAWGERTPVIFVTGSSTLKRQGPPRSPSIRRASPTARAFASLLTGPGISQPAVTPDQCI